jgi:C_GCAxxG_C_C family probable redox protein
MPNDIVATAVARADELYGAGHHCSEAVLMGVGEQYLQPLPDVLVRASDPFGGGVGACREELCGVLSGGVLLLGALYGRVDPEEDDKPLMELACQYRQQIIDRFGSSLCNPIRDTMPEELTKRCAEVVHEAARLLATLIEANAGQFTVRG